LALASNQATSQLFKAHAQSLAPAIRTCKYNLGTSYEAEESEEEDEAAPAASMRQEDLAGLSYRGKSLISPSEKIKAKLLNCLQLVKDVKAGSDDDESAAVIEKYGEVAAEFGEVLKDIHADMINGIDDKDAAVDGPSEAEWRLLEAFARELSICMNIERNLVLMWNLLVKLDGLEDISSAEARKTCRPEEGMRFCDLLKEDLQSLGELPETTNGITKSLEVYVAVAQNCRCLFLSLCHSLVGKSLESAALLDMLRGRVEDVDLGEALDEPLDRLHSQFGRIVEGMPSRVSQWRCRGLAMLCSKAKTKTKEQAKQDSGDASFPPRARDIPCKPLLFDLAFPCIEAPDFEEMLPKGRPSAGQGADKGPGLLGRVAGGIGNRLGGLWGRK
jgi:hypothetical protein